MLREQAAGMAADKIRDPVENAGSVVGVEYGVVNIADQR
jgi:hypothetical protein